MMVLQDGSGGDGSGDGADGHGVTCHCYNTDWLSDKYYWDCARGKRQIMKGMSVLYDVFLTL